MSTADILVLGVGFTGLLVAKTLARHRERSAFTFAIAGRSQDKLDAIVSRPPLEEIKALRVDVSNSIELDLLVRQFRVVINCTSKYWKLGIPVVKACVSAGTHYLDLTGELPFYLQSVTLFDHLEEGVAPPSVVIHACGYESIPSDIVVLESTEKLREEYGTNTRISTSTTAMDLQKVFVSRGTAASGISMLQDVPRDIFWKSLKPFSLSPIQGKSSPSTLVYDLQPHASLVGSFFLLAANNVAAVNRTWGLLQSTQSLAAYGEEFHYTEFLVAPSRVGARVASLTALAAASTLIYVPPASREVLTVSSFPSFRLHRVSFITSDLKTGSICVTNITRSMPSAHDSKPHHAKTVFRTIGGDGGYMGSAVTVTECALLLLLHERSELPWSSCRGFRVLTPVVAFGSLLTKRLIESGFYEITTEIID
ncbi:Saccharopine dehydrogenase-domain-containing protein [Mycena latifolia]|nr:Saccharopine dehydrogenase-domain-containing protein [Mycena latifolia]